MTPLAGSGPGSAARGGIDGPRETTRRALLAGGRDVIPVVLGYIPFALALGAALSSAGVDPLTAWCSSWLMVAGAAQLAAVQLLGAGADVLVVIAGGLIINLRHLLYGAALARHTADWPARWRWIGSYFLTDPVYALAVGRFGRPDGGGGGSARLTYFVTVGLGFWVSWQLLTGAGVLLGEVLPTALPVHLAAPLTFVCLVAPLLTDAAGYLAAGTAGVVALSCSGLPTGLGLLVGSAVGIAVGATIGTRDE